MTFKNRDCVEWIEFAIALVEVALTIVITVMIWQKIGFGTRQEKATSNLIDATSRQATALDQLAAKETLVSNSLDKMNQVIQEEESLSKARETRETKQAAKKPLIKLFTEQMQMPLIAVPEAEANGIFQGASIVGIRLYNAGDAPLFDASLNIYVDSPKVVLSCSNAIYIRCVPGNTRQGEGSVLVAELGTLRIHSSARLDVNVVSTTDMLPFKVHILITGDNLAPTDLGSFGVQFPKIIGKPD